MAAITHPIIAMLDHPLSGKPERGLFGEDKCARFPSLF